MGDEGPTRWLLLIYRVAQDPPGRRTYVWRQLKGLGAVYLQQAAAILPDRPELRAALTALTARIREQEGEASLGGRRPRARLAGGARRGHATRGAQSHANRHGPGAVPGAPTSAGGGRTARPPGARSRDTAADGAALGSRLAPTRPHGVGTREPGGCGSVAWCRRPAAAVHRRAGAPTATAQPGGDTAPGGPNRRRPRLADTELRPGARDRPAVGPGVADPGPRGHCHLRRDRRSPSPSHRAPPERDLAGRPQSAPHEPLRGRGADGPPLADDHRGRLPSRHCRLPL